MLIKRRFLRPRKLIRPSLPRLRPPRPILPRSKLPKSAAALQQPRAQPSAPNGPPAEMLDPILRGVARLVIVDAGCADGIDAIGYAKHYPDAQVHAFDPVSENIALLQHALRTQSLAGRVTVHQLALSDKAGLCKMWRSGGKYPSGAVLEPWPYSSSLLPPKAHLEHYPWCTFAEWQVDADRLDTVLARHGVDHVDYMHIDVQGAELLVLRGAGELLKGIKAVWLEVSSVEMYEGQPLVDDVAAFLREAGMTLRCETLGTKGQEYQGDAFWVRG